MPPTTLTACVCADISGLAWTRLGARGCQLGVRRSDGPTTNFLGFKDKVGSQQTGGGAAAAAAAAGAGRLNVGC